MPVFKELFLFSKQFNQSIIFPRIEKVYFFWEYAEHHKACLSFKQSMIITKSLTFALGAFMFSFVYLAPINSLSSLIHLLLLSNQSTHKWTGFNCNRKNNPLTGLFCLCIQLTRRALTGVVIPIVMYVWC